MNIQATNNGQTLHFSVSRQLNSIWECWEDLCLGKSPCHCAAADCLLSSNAAPQTSESSLLTFHSFSLSHSCTLWTLDLLHIQSGFNSFNPTFPPSGCRKRAHLQSNPVSGQHSFSLKYRVFAFWVPGIWSFSSSASTLTMTHCSAARPIAALCSVKPKCSVYIGSSVRQAHGGTIQLLSIAWLPSGK